MKKRGSCVSRSSARFAISIRRASSSIWAAAASNSMNCGAAFCMESIGLPLGTVRLMEAFHAQGVIHEHTANEIRLHVLSVLQSALPSRPRPSGAYTVACGGNAETLAALAAGPRIRRLHYPESPIAARSALAHSAAECGRAHEIIFRAPGPRGGDGRCGHRSGDRGMVAAAAPNDHAARGSARGSAVRTGLRADGPAGAHAKSIANARKICSPARSPLPAACVAI